MSIANFVTNVQEVRKHQQSCNEFLKVVTILSDNADPGKIFMGLFRLLCRFGKSIPHVGGLLVSAEGMLPDEDSKDVVRLLQDLSEQIKMVKHDIRELENKINWEATKLQYCDIVTKIETGIKFVVKISESSKDDERKRHEQRLIDLCSGQSMTLAVENLLKGLAPGQDFFHNDILENIYCITGGHRGIMERMCIRFLQLVCGGLSVIDAYEKLRHGEEGALDMKNWFEDDTVKKLKTLFEAYQQRCTDCVEKNMQKDLKKEALDSKMSNKDAALHLSKFLREKYDWLETYSIICNESIFIDYDFSGDHVKSLECNGRFGVIFYRERLKDPALVKFPRSITPQSRLLDQVQKVIRDTDKDCWFSDAKRINSVLTASLRRNGVCLWGCATVKAKRIISIPLINIPVLIGSRKALDCFKISGTWTKYVFDDGGHKHLCLLK